MEREQEIARLVNVLRQTGRMAMQSEWTGSNPDAAAYCVAQYNRVLKRLEELEPEIGAVFAPLPPESSLLVAAIACKQLAAYFGDEERRGRPWGGSVHAFGFDPAAFKDFWRESAQEIEDLGEFIRESVGEWARRRRRASGHCGHRPDAPPRQEEEKPAE